MRQIPYPNRSKFYPIIKDYILNLDNKKQDGIDIKIELPESEPDGYRGEYIVKIDSVQPFFETDFKNKDITRFPARIKATALALKESNNIGEFYISHEKRIITIRSVNNKTPLTPCIILLSLLIENCKPDNSNTYIPSIPGTT